MSKKIKAYQVGDNDIVAAYNVKQAIDTLTEMVGAEFTETLSDEDVTEKHPDMDICDEEGNVIGKLGDMIKGITEPEYLFGWE